MSDTTTVDASKSAPANVSGVPERGGIATLLGFLLAALSGLMLFTTWAGHGNIWPFVFIAFVPMLVAAYRLLPRRLAPFAYAIAAFGYTLALALDAGGVLPVVAVLGWALIIGAMFFVFGIFEQKYSRRTNYKWFIVQFALIWTACELVFQNNLLIGTGYWMEYRTASAPWMAQAVSWTSTPAWGFVIIMFNAGIALLIIRAIDARWPKLADVPIPKRTVAWSTIIAFGTMIVWLVTSALINASVDSSLGRTVRVASIQSGIQNTTSSGQLGEGGEQNTPADNARNERLRVQLTALTRKAAAQGAKLAVWPEEELDYDVRVGDKAAWVGELAKETDMTIVSGFMPDSPSLTSPNLTAVWFPNGEMSNQFYSKEHQVVAEGEAFQAGVKPAVYPTNVGELGVIICFDHDFPDSSPRETTIAGADIIAAPAIDPYTIVNDRWQSLVFRSLENRVPFVKTDVGFDSVIINANGQVQARNATADPAGSTQVLVADVNLGPRDAPFTQYGSYPLMALVVLFLVWRYVAQIRMWRRDRKTGDQTGQE